jgi:hypothetical protein
MTMMSECTALFKERLLQWLGETLGERVDNWEQASQGDIVCFALQHPFPD